MSFGGFGQQPHAPMSENQLPPPEVEVCDASLEPLEAVY